MDAHHYYRAKKKDLPAIIDTLTECFSDDDLYKHLIPEEHLRRRILPDVFSCDAEEMLGYCDVLGDSAEFKGLLIMTDSAEKRSAKKRAFLERLYLMKTDLMLIRNDPSLQTLHRFNEGHPFLTSDWTNEFEGDQLHIVYLAVRKKFHGQGVARKLLNPVLNYADEKDMSVTLETHNPKNIGMYEHFGFHVYKTLSNDKGLFQYCLIRLKKSQREGLAERVDGENRSAKAQ